MGTEGRMGARQRSMVRNLTEYYGDRFAPSVLEKGIAVLKMGAAHADRTAVRSDGAWWEAPYLDQRFEPTRGRVATMFFDGIGYRFDDVSGVSKRTHKTWAANYHRLVDDYLQALRAGILQEGELLGLDATPLPGVEKVVLQRAYSWSENALLVNDVNESILLDAGLDASNAAWDRFDALVYVVGGRLEAPYEK